MTEGLAGESSSDPFRGVQAAVTEQVAQLDGRMVKSETGSVVAEFASALNALRCAAELRSAMAGAGAPDGVTQSLRYGLHVADVMQPGDEPVGDASAVALALGQTAGPEEVLLSGAFFDHVHRHSPYNFDDLGPRDIDGVSRDMPVYRMRGEISAHRMQAAPTQLRGGRKKRPFEEMLSLLDDITAKIAATVFGRVEDASMVATGRKLPENMTAFECVLRGMAHHRLGGVTDDHVHKAIEWFDKAIAADPDYAAAHAWRVCSLTRLPNLDMAAAEISIRHALELDPNDAEAYRILATIELLNENHASAAAMIRKAIELNPTDAYVKSRCAAIFTYTGEAGLSLAMLDEAESLDPFLPVWCFEERGVALYAPERYEEVLQAQGKLAFQTWRSRLYRAAALVALDRPQEARKLVKEAIVGRPDITATHFMVHERYQDTEKRSELRHRLEMVGLPK